MGEGCRGESEPTTEDDDDELRGFRLCSGLNDAGTAEEVLPVWGDEMWPGAKLGGVGEKALGADVTGGCAEPFLEWEGAKLGGRSLPVALLFVICPRLLIFLEKPILPRYTDIMDQRDPAECEGAGHRADPFAVSVVAVLRHFADSVVEVTIGDADRFSHQAWAFPPDSANPSHRTAVVRGLRSARAPSAPRKRELGIAPPACLHLRSHLNRITAWLP